MATVSYKMWYEPTKLAGIGLGSEVVIYGTGFDHAWYEGKVVKFSEKGALIFLEKVVATRVLRVGSFPINVHGPVRVADMTIGERNICEENPLFVDGAEATIIKVEFDNPITIHAIELEWVEKMGDGYLPSLQLKQQAA